MPSRPRIRKLCPTCDRYCLSLSMSARQHQSVVSSSVHVSRSKPYVPWVWLSSSITIVPVGCCFITIVANVVPRAIPTCRHLSRSYSIPPLQPRNQSIFQCQQPTFVSYATHIVMMAPALYPNVLSLYSLFFITHLLSLMQPMLSRFSQLSTASPMAKALISGQRIPNVLSLFTFF